MDSPARHRDHEWRRTVILPTDVRDRLVDLARRNERSTSAEIRFAIKRHIERADRHERAAA